MTLPLIKLNDKLSYSDGERQSLIELYEYLKNKPDDYEGISIKGKGIPGIVFNPTYYNDEFPVLSVAKSRYPFLKDKCSFIVTGGDCSTNEFKPHSDESHGSILTVLKGDDKAITRWYTIEGAPAFEFSNDLYGVVPHSSSELSLRHEEILTKGSTYLFDSHTFHSIINPTGVSRIVFTWWLEHIAYQPAYEYYDKKHFI